MTAPSIKPFAPIVPMVYCYITPGVPSHDGWCKTGYTEKQSVEERVKQQCHTADVDYDIRWQDNAMYKDGSGEYFTDHDFHGYLTGKRKAERKPDTEWFHLQPMVALEYFSDFATRKPVANAEHAGTEYVLRQEQDDAVRRTMEYFEGGGSEFLWNAKPRFGKTLTTYDLVRRMGLQRVLIVTNRPSIANSWYDDFQKFFAWRGEAEFVSDNQALEGKPGCMTRKEYFNAHYARGEEFPPMVAFESLQGLKGSLWFGGKYRKLQWIAQTEWDLLVVDESHEGVDTTKTDQAFKNIKRKHTLYLSGTPFKALADGRFGKKQIFNWTYADEQDKKKHWDGDTFSPYEGLPQLEMYTYQMSSIVEGSVRKGAAIADDGESVEYAFDLNEFFSTKESEDGKVTFVHRDAVVKFLDALTLQERFPYSTPELRSALSHTIWLLDRVASAKALAKLLEKHPVFSAYKVIVAAGDGWMEEDDEHKVTSSLQKVRDEIAANEKTITLSVGQLTVGVTVPEWTGIMMLCNLKSPSSYMQAAFRVQNPYEGTEMVDGKPRLVRKERAYVFDFDPARTLIIYDEFANNLSVSTAGGNGTQEERKEHIKTLLNFFPVYAEDPDGTMERIDEQQVLSIPRRLKCTEVVRHGFISNYLFANISNIFGAPSAVTEIVKKLTPAREDSFDARQNALDSMGDVQVGEDGEVEVPEEVVIGRHAELFGDKIYETLEEGVEPALDDLEDEDDLAKMMKSVRQVGDALKGTIEREVIQPAVEATDLGKRAKSRTSQITRDVHQQINRHVEQLSSDFEREVRVAQAERDRKVKEAQTTHEVEAAKAAFQTDIATAMEAFKKSTADFVQQVIDEQPKEVARKLETFKAEDEKASVEDTVRANLRGFARTIPSFLMAYGDRNLTLANLDDYTEDDVFLEVTGISEDEFRFLRDGGDYFDETNKRTEHFAGGLFDETVFNDSVQEFLNKREELADYFDESHDEDIFDYIPPQKTNQVFTPRWMVRKMVDALEEENPGCFDDPEATFADLYMKSGLYITEVVKRLYASEGLQRVYPDDTDRICHILEHQVYGMAPTRIIYLIATNYILGFDELMKATNTHFVHVDAAEASKNGTLQRLVLEYFGE